MLFERRLDGEEESRRFCLTSHQSTCFNSCSTLTSLFHFPMDGGHKIIRFSPAYWVHYGNSQRPDRTVLYGYLYCRDKCFTDNCVLTVFFILFISDMNSHTIISSFTVHTAFSVGKIQLTMRKLTKGKWGTLGQPLEHHNTFLWKKDRGEKLQDKFSFNRP